MSGKPQKHVHKINNFPIAASKAVPGSSLDADISALNDKLSTKKDRQDPVASPDADGSGIAFIDTLSQDTNGKITVTKKNVQQASTSSAGIVQLSSKIDSTSETMAATPKAVHDAIIDTVAGLNVENTVPDGHYITSVDETDGFVSITTAAMDDVPTRDSTKPVKSGGVFASIGAEAIERAGADAAFQQLIPPAASEHNQLADKAYVDAIGERVEARYLSYSQDGLPFPTYDDFVAAQQTDTFYYMNALTAPNNNDVIVITADRTHLNENGQPTTTRWRFFKPEIGPGEWRYEGEIYSSKQDPAYKEGAANDLYAPDVVQGNDGRYYLYYGFAGTSGHNCLNVAVCDTPVGCYEYLGFVRNPDGSVHKTYLMGDPAVINDEGTIRLYMGWSLSMVAADAHKQGAGYADGCRRAETDRSGTV